MHKSNFPDLETLEAKIKQHCQASDLYALIEKSISLLIAKTLDDFSNEEKNFLKEQLCKMITRTIKYDHKSSLDDSILKLFLEVINLSISTKLNPYAIQSLTPFFDINSHEPDIFPITSELQDNVYDFSNSLIKSEMIILKPHISPFNEKLLRTFFEKSILDITISMINSNEINIQQIAAIMNFFRKIQYFLDKELSLSLCIFFAKYSIKLLTIEQYGSDGVSNILTFFKTFMNHLNYLQTDIFHLMTEMLHKQTQNQYDALTLFLSMIQNSQIQRNQNVQKLIKKNLISLLQQTSNIQIFQEVYENLSSLSKVITFTPDELTNFICHLRKIPNDANTIIVNLIPCISNPFLKPMNNILLGLNLISCTDNDGISNLVLKKTIFNFDKKCNLNSSSFKLTEKIANLIMTGLNSNQEQMDLIKLGYFLSNFPRYDLIYEYIMKITEEEDFEIYSPILKRIAISSNKFESEKLLSSIAQNVIEEFIGRRFTPRISRLTEVVVNMITNFVSVPESQIMMKLISIDYYKCPDEIPAVVSAIMSRATNRRLIRQLINKIMKDTVPEKHANWAINMAFDALHDEKRDIEKIAEILFQLLYENSKKTNVIYMIYQAVLYEADFYNIGKINKNSGLKIDTILEEQLFSFSVHPLHSARRIYTEVGRFLQKRLFNFTLYIKGKEILPDQPLSVIPLKYGNDKKLKIKVKFGENENRNDYCRLFLQPIFIEYIQRTERFTALFNLMNNFNTESEILFLVLNLIDNETIKPVLSSPIQQIFKRDYFMSFVDLDSFRLFPFILDAARGSKTVYSSSYLSVVFQRLNDQNLDQVSLLMSCNLLSSFAVDSCQFDTILIRNCLIKSNKKMVRETMSDVLDKTDEKEKLLFLLPSTAQIAFRNKTKQFFSLLKKKKIDQVYVEPLLKLVTQYETEFDGDIDETINGIFSMDLSPTDDTFELVFGFLFTPPTVRSKYLPFLHSSKSRKNAYNFILKYDNCIDKLSSILALVPMNSGVKKLNDNFSYYKRGFLYPLKHTSAILILLHSIEAFRNFVIITDFKYQFLKELSNLFFEMTFTCLPSVNVNDFESLNKDGSADLILSNFFNGILKDIGYNPIQKEILHVTCRLEKVYFNEECQKVANKDDHIIFFNIENPRHTKFKFPLFFDNFILRAVAVKSDDNDYSVIYRGREISNVTDLMNRENSYIFNNYSRSCWYIAENNELSKYDISELPERCFGGKKKKQSAFLLAYENINIDLPKICVSRYRQEEIDRKNASAWPSVLCNSHGFISFARELFEKDVDNYLDFGFEAFFKIAIIDDDSLNAWKELLINKVLIDERKSEIFLSRFLSNDTLIEKVDLSKSGTFILPELFSFAKSKYNIDFESSFELIQIFEKSTSPKQFGFVCDILASLITDSSIDIDACRYGLILLTKILSKIGPIYSIFDRVLNCFNSIMVIISSSINDQNEEIINWLISEEFLQKWFEIMKKSEPFRSILESVMVKSPHKFTTEISPLIDKILNSTHNSMSPLPVSPVAHNSPILNNTKRINKVKLIKRKNRPNNEFNDQINPESTELQNEDHDSVSLNLDEFNDTSGQIQSEIKTEPQNIDQISTEFYTENITQNIDDVDQQQHHHHNHDANEESEVENIESQIHNENEDQVVSAEESDREIENAENGHEESDIEANENLTTNINNAIINNEEEEEEEINESVDVDANSPPSSSLLSIAAPLNINNNIEINDVGDDDEEEEEEEETESENENEVNINYNQPQSINFTPNQSQSSSSIFNFVPNNTTTNNNSGTNLASSVAQPNDYSDDSYGLEEEEEETGEIEQDDFASRKSHIFSTSNDDLSSGNSNNNASSDFIVISNSNSENNLNKNNESNFEMIQSSDELTESGNDSNRRRNNEDDVGQIPFEFDMKTNSQTSESDVE